MCEALTSRLGDATQDAGKLLIEDKKPGERPVGRGGMDRRRRIDEIVDGAQSGLRIPTK